MGCMIFLITSEGNLLLTIVFDVFKGAHESSNKQKEIIQGPLLTASSCFFFWIRSSSIRLTFARSRFSWSGFKASWNICHLDPFWISEEVFKNCDGPKESQHLTMKGFESYYMKCIRCTYRMV